MHLPEVLQMSKLSGFHAASWYMLYRMSRKDMWHKYCTPEERASLLLSISKIRPGQCRQLVYDAI